jgi:hypothetical protein
MRSLYVLSFTRSLGVGNPPLNFGASGQAKSDNLDPQERQSRGKRLALRCAGCKLSDVCRNPRIHARDVRES